MKNISGLSNNCSIGIYEFFQQFRNTGGRIIALNDFRSMLGIENKYKQSRDLNKILIRPCIDELSKKSDLAVTIEMIKKGHTVAALHFHFKENKRVKVMI